MKRKICITDLGRMDYNEALAIQEKLMSMRQQGMSEDTLLLVEHPPVLTLGRRAAAENIVVPRETLEKEGVGIYEVSRGGDVTYHGPGQIVGYPILDLTNFGKDIRLFVSNIVEVFICMLECEYGIHACRDESKYTGVWVGNEKITAIGIAVKRWVSMHGFAFNVKTHLEHFKWIVPCGLSDRGVTSLEKLLGRDVDFEEVKRLTVKYFCEVFEAKPQVKGLKTLGEELAANETAAN
jgi:lipoyl(octanoyl) transferase